MMSKFSLEVLNKRVFPYLASNDPDVILGSKFGEDVALTQLGGNILVSHMDPIIGAVKNIGRLAVHVACNDIATSGTPPRWLQVLVLVPKKEDEDLLEIIMADIGRGAKETQTSIIGGHAGYSASLSRPLVAVTALGTLINLEPVYTKGAKPGDHVLISKGIPLEGTAILANDFSKAALKLGLTEEDLSEARQLMDQVSVIPEALIFAKHGATSMHDVTRGGLLETLLEIADLSNNCIRIDYEMIPISRVCDRFANAFGFDPLMMISSGTLVATIPPEHVNDAKQALRQAGIAYSDIGEVVSGEGVKILRDCEMLHYQEIQPDKDELARIWLEFKPDRSK
jgi:hydrogenase expression/formation protein HypE